MSSIIFEVVLKPDENLRRLVQGSGIVLMVLGILLILQMPFAHFWRVLAILVWLAECLREQKNLQSGFSRLRSLSLGSNGAVVATDIAGDRHELILMTGSVVFPCFAWFRLRFSDGACHSELFTGKRSEPLAWHRLQLLWRQAHTAFGHPPGP